MLTKLEKALLNRVAFETYYKLVNKDEFFNVRFVSEDIYPEMGISVLQGIEETRINADIMKPILMDILSEAGKSLDLDKYTDEEYKVLTKATTKAFYKASKKAYRELTDMYNEKGFSAKRIEKIEKRIKKRAEKYLRKELIDKDKEE